MIPRLQSINTGRFPWQEKRQSCKTSFSFLRQKRKKSPEFRHPPPFSILWKTDRFQLRGNGRFSYDDWFFQLFLWLLFQQIIHRVDWCSCSLPASRCNGIRWHNICHQNCICFRILFCGTRKQCKWLRKIFHFFLFALRQVLYDKPHMNASFFQNWTQIQGNAILGIQANRSDLLFIAEPHNIRMLFQI